MKQIGILGGTFDPPHIGHFIIADEVKYACGLDEIWFIPTNEPPHKRKATSTSEHRLHMVEKATEHTAYFKVKSIELDRRGTSYTIDTINELQEKYPTFFFSFIIGADMVEYLPKWKQIDELARKIQFIGVKRPNYRLTTCYPIREVNVPLIDISSTEIRKRIEMGLPVQYLLPKEVYSYMKEHRLYETS